jgi:hypothetical protein
MNLPDVIKIAAILRLTFDINLPGPTIQIEVVYEEAAERRLERREYVIHVEAECLCLIAVDVEVDRRCRARELRKYPAQPRVLVRRADQSLDDTAKFDRILSFECLKLIFEPAACGKTDDRRQIESHDRCRSDLLTFREHLADQRLRGILDPAAVLERLELGEKEAGVGFVGGIE